MIAIQPLTEAISYFLLLSDSYSFLRILSVLHREGEGVEYRHGYPVNAEAAYF